MMNRISYWSVLVFLLGLLYLHLWIEVRWEQVMLIAGDYLLLTATLATPPLLYLTYRSIQQDKKNNEVNYSPTLTILVFLAGFPISVFICGYILVISLNALLSPQSPVLYQGEIVIKEEVRGKSTYYYFVLNEVDSYGFELRLAVSAIEYRAYDEGERYQRYMQRGGLGIDYRLSW